MENKCNTYIKSYITMSKEGLHYFDKVDENAIKQSKIRCFQLGFIYKGMNKSKYGFTFNYEETFQKVDISGYIIDEKPYKKGAVRYFYKGIFLASDTYDDFWGKETAIKCKKDIAEYRLKQLIYNNFKYFAHYKGGLSYNLIETLKFIKDNNYTFIEDTTLHETSWKKGNKYFMGNLNEISSSFFYTVIDKNLQKIIQKELSTKK